MEMNVMRLITFCAVSLVVLPVVLGYMLVTGNSANMDNVQSKEEAC